MNSESSFAESQVKEGNLNAQGSEEDDSESDIDSEDERKLDEDLNLSKNVDTKVVEPGKEKAKTGGGATITSFFVVSEKQGTAKAKIATNQDKLLPPTEVTESQSEANAVKAKKAKKKSEQPHESRNKELLIHFTEDPKFATGESKTSHICKKCQTAVSCTAPADSLKDKAGKTRRLNQYQNLRKHLQLHQALWRSIVEERRKNEAQKVEVEKTEQEKEEKMIVDNAQLSVGQITLEHHLKAANEKKLPGIFSLPSVKGSAEKRLLMTAAYWFARDNMSQNSGSKDGFRIFFETFPRIQKVSVRISKKHQDSFARPNRR